MRGKLAPNAIYKKDLATYNDLTHNNALYRTPFITEMTDRTQRG